MEIRVVGSMFKVAVRTPDGRKSIVHVHVPLWNINNAKETKPFIEAKVAPATVTNWAEIRKQRAAIRANL